MGAGVVSFLCSVFKILLWYFCFSLHIYEYSSSKAGLRVSVGPDAFAKSRQNAAVININKRMMKMVTIPMQHDAMKHPGHLLQHCGFSCFSRAASQDTTNNDGLGERERSGRPDVPQHPTLALMMVGLGSKMPCIFLKAGMTKRLQVTTADTGFPRTDRVERGRGGRDRKRKISE